MAKKSPVKILYVGNSFTTRNDVPGLLAKLAGSGSGITVESQVIAAGGASLRQHWNAGRALDMMRKTKFDYVVLQEQSTLPIKNTKRFHENVREFAPAVKESGSELVLYLTWAREKVPETQALLSSAYFDIGKEIGATVVPAGVAWEAFLRKYDQPVLHAPDGSHPTLAGSYLAACCFYATLLGGDPVGAETPSVKLAAADKKKLASIAKREFAKKR